MTRDVLKLLAKLDEMVVESYKHGAGNGLMTTNEFVKWNQKRLRSSPSCADSAKYAAVGAGYASVPFPKDSCGSRNDGDSNGGGERRKVCGDACCLPHNVLEAQRVVQPDGWSRRSSSARVRRERSSARPTSTGRNEGLKNEGIQQKRSIGRSLFSSRVDKTGLQSHVISKPRCRAKLHGIFKQAQRQSRDGRFLLLVGGYGQLVGNQIARLSSCGVVILSEFLSPDFDLNSFTVRNVLRGWIAPGDVAAVCFDSPTNIVYCRVSSQNMSSSKRSWFLRGAHQQYESSVFRALCQQ